LGAGGSIDLTIYAIKGIGQDHVKWAPSGLVGNAHMADVWINAEEEKKLTIEQKKEFVKTCQKGVFALDIEDTIRVVKSSNCNFCNDCTLYSENVLNKSNLVASNIVPRYRKIPITSNGQFASREIMKRSFDVCIEKLNDMFTEVAEYVNQVESNNVSTKDVDGDTRMVLAKEE